MSAMTMTELVPAIAVNGVPRTGLEWRRWARAKVEEFELNAGEANLLRLLADRSDARGRVVAGAALLAGQLRLSEDRTRKLLGQLRQSGLVRTSQRGRGRVAVHELIAEPVVRQLSLFDEPSAPAATPDPPVSLTESASVPVADTAPAIPAVEPSSPGAGARKPWRQQPAAVEGADNNRVSPVVGGRADGRTISISAELLETAQYVRGILQRGIDGLTCDETPRPPGLDAIIGALERHDPSREDAIGIAVEARSIAQAQNRAPNIAALYERRLGEHRCASQQRHRALPSEARAEAVR